MNPLDAIEQASDYVARLASVEHAFMIGDEPELHYLLSNVDPIDARHVANVLRTLALSLRGVPGAVSVGSADGSVSPLPSRVTSDEHTAGDGQASAPEPHPYITHGSDYWASRKVPCG